METHFQKTAGLLGNPHLYSTASVCRIDAESAAVEEALYDEAAQYREDIARSMGSSRTDEYPENDLAFEALEQQKEQEPIPEQGAGM